MSVPGVLPPVMAAVEEYRARSEHYARVRYLRERRALAATRVAVRSASGRHEINVRWARGAGAELEQPVVLVHGYGISSAYMVPLAVRLAPHFPVYAPDLPGHGWSDKPLHVLDVRDLANVLLAFLDEMRVERASLIGNSMGCQTIADLAARHPERVDRVVLLGPTADASARTVRHHVARFALTTLAERPSLLPLLAADYMRARPHRMWLELRHMLDDSIERKLADVTAPTLIVRGERDRIVPAAWAARLGAVVPNAEVRTLPRWGHAINYSGAVELVPLVTEFLTRPAAQRTTVAG